jgi:hypothetical protein
MEAAPADISGKAWAISTEQTNSSGATGTAIGTGGPAGVSGTNTALILGQNTNNPAAKACDDSTAGGLGTGTWFLPSKDELAAMYTNLHMATPSVGGFGTGYYWSSSEYNSGHAWYQNFNTGTQGYNGKAGQSSVRAVRTF